MASCLLLLAIGFGIALLIGSGSVFLLALAIMGMVFLPWTKIVVCRDHFFIFLGLVGAGVLLGLAVPGRSVHTLYYPLAAWVLLTAACIVSISASLPTATGSTGYRSQATDSLPGHRPVPPTGQAPSTSGFGYVVRHRLSHLLVRSQSA